METPNRKYPKSIYLLFLAGELQYSQMRFPIKFFASSTGGGEAKNCYFHPNKEAVTKKEFDAVNDPLLICNGCLKTYEELQETIKKPRPVDLMKRLGIKLDDISSSRLVDLTVTQVSKIEKNGGKNEQISNEKVKNNIVSTRCYKCSKENSANNRTCIYCGAELKESSWKGLGQVAFLSIFLVGLVLVLTAIFEPSTFEDLTAEGVLWGLGTTIFLFFVAWLFVRKE